MRTYYDPLDDVLRRHNQRQALFDIMFADRWQRMLTHATYRLNEAEATIQSPALSKFWQCYWPYGTRWNASSSSPIGGSQYYDSLPVEHQGSGNYGTSKGWITYGAHYSKLPSYAQRLRVAEILANGGTEDEARSILP